MRNFDPSTLSTLQDRSGIIARQMIWFSAKNRTTGATETIGFWNGDDHVTLTIDGDERTYFGAGTTMRVPRIITEVGIQARTHRITFSAVAAETLIALRQYNARHAPVEIHRALYDINTRSLVSEPHRVFKGWINNAPIPRKPPGEDATLDISLTSSARALTRNLALMKSDESQKLRADDRFRKYADISGDVTTYWGEVKV